MRYLSTIFLIASFLLYPHWSSAENFSNYRDIVTVPAAGGVPTRTELPQGWDQQTRENFWFTSQGSRIIPYTWFAWLEQPNNQAYFRDTAHMESLRYLPIEPSKMNPAGLPIGFTLDHDKKSGTAWMGLTCAACHTNQLDYNGRKFLIEGAPTLANFKLFFDRLVAALNATHENDDKFDRFARKVLGQNYDSDDASELRRRLGEVAHQTTERARVNATPGYPDDFSSYARLDAFGNIQNAGTAFALRDLSNNNAPTAPVSYPFLWGTHQSDVVQWNASAPNTPVIGPLVRNIGEVVGVFGGLSIKEVPWWKWIFVWRDTDYSSTVDLAGLGNLESWVKTLRSPQWSDAYLPSIDTGLANEGASLYASHCASCHQVIPRERELERYKADRTPLTEVGTDPAMAWNAANHLSKTLALEGTKTKILIGDRFEEIAPSIEIPVNGVVGVVLENPLKALRAGLRPMSKKTDLQYFEEEENEDTLEDHIAKHFDRWQALNRSTVKSDRTGDFQTNAVLMPDDERLAGLVYKARPLNGIWATAPFLHNGSVPNRWELLQAPEDRLKRFRVGSREFDPVNVGFVTDTGPSEFSVLDESGQTQPGNSNAGHVYGAQLNDREKWALVEYMKTL